MFEAMRQAAFLHKLRPAIRARFRRPTRSQMATIDGARALGMERDDRLARSREARRPDRRLDDVARARRRCTIPFSHLVYVTRGDDVRTTIVNGRVLMRDRQVLTLNEAAVLAEAQDRPRRSRGASGAIGK